MVFDEIMQLYRNLDKDGKGSEMRKVSERRRSVDCLYLEKRNADHPADA